MVPGVTGSLQGGTAGQRALPRHSQRVADPGSIGRIRVGITGFATVGEREADERHVDGAIAFCRGLHRPGPADTRCADETSPDDRPWPRASAVMNHMYSR